MYKRSKGKVEADRRYLRAWGEDGYLDTKGIFKTTLTTSRGASKRTWVYVVAGARPELFHHREAPAAQGQDQGQGRGHHDRQQV